MPSGCPDASTPCVAFLWLWEMGDHVEGLTHSSSWSHTRKKRRAWWYSEKSINTQADDIHNGWYLLKVLSRVWFSVVVVGGGTVYSILTSWWFKLLLYTLLVRVASSSASITSTSSTVLLLLELRWKRNPNLVLILVITVIWNRVWRTRLRTVLAIIYWFMVTEWLKEQTTIKSEALLYFLYRLFPAFILLLCTSTVWKQFENTAEI